MGIRTSVNRKATGYFEYQGASIDDLVDFPPEIRQLAVEAVMGFRLGPLYTPHSLRGTIFRPGAVAGANWGLLSRARQMRRLRSPRR